MTTEYFTLKEDGVIGWIEKMPPKPREQYPQLCTMAEITEYQQALQSAIFNAKEVSNQNEVLRALASENEWDDWYRSEEGVQGYMTVGAAYPLLCSVEKKQVEVPCPEGKPGCSTIHLRPRAFVTFSEPSAVVEETQAFDNLVDAMESKNVKVTFGLQPHHIEAIETEFKRWRDMPPPVSFPDYECQPEFMKAVWDGLGRQLGWCPFTLALYYFEHTSNRKNK